MPREIGGFGQEGQGEIMRGQGSGFRDQGRKIMKREQTQIASRVFSNFFLTPDP